MDGYIDGAGGTRCSSTLADLGLATAAAHTPRGALCSAGSALASRNVLELGSCLGFALPLLGSTPT